MSRAHLLPSDELHFLRWFWTQSNELIGWCVIEETSIIDNREALTTYEDETGRAAPADYWVGVV